MVLRARMIILLTVPAILTWLLPPAGSLEAQESEYLVEGLPTATLETATPLFALRRQGRLPALVFSRSGAAEDHDPRVLVSGRDSWRPVQLSERLHNTTWIFVGRAIEGEDVWAVAEGDVGGRGPYLELVTSGNGGRTWAHQATFVKISRHAVLDAFGIHPDGRGSLILRLDEDPSPGAPRLGYYLYLTRNGGKTWSEPIYSYGRPPVPSSLAAPDDKLSYTEPPGLDAWRRILSILLRTA